ncbi:glycoside hydrolase family 18 protein [Pedobacter sp. SYSU D00535]|uniref:glycoside hydrolase family 18 protein n=1 Tax=Pedobacter sp. SYSU D00535 TaxID=2810308 RepID=UPI001A9567E5|nr:glycoside hydrolase family 18 protein [Pedobacter sp. SYSU D00535]
MQLFLNFLKLILLLSLAFAAFVPSASAQSQYNVIAYFLGGSSKVSSIDPTKLTHIIHSFEGIRGNKFVVSDSITVRRLVALKKKNPKLKVLLAFAGWGGCKTCSDVFQSAANREAFAKSVKSTCERLGADGIDLDWEYPAVEGFIGHKYAPEDKNTFTLLVQQLRKTLGSKYEISFAAGAFTEYLEKSIDWAPVMREVDRVNLMTYDLVNGYSRVTGHHTPLYSTGENKESVNNAVEFLLRQGVPANKIVIGAAFYARTWQNVPDRNNGLYQPGTFRNTVAIKNFISVYTPANGFRALWDDTAQAPFLYSPSRKLFVTFDDNRSVKLKTEYMMERKLNGIMFWQILHDKSSGSLLGTIVNTIGQNK